MSVQYAFERWLKIPCETIQALEYSRYYYQFTDANTLLICPSSSGTTERTYENLVRGREEGAFVLGVTNTRYSPLTLEVDDHILVRATRMGWPTQASTAAMAALYLLALEWAKARGTMADDDWARLNEEVFALPSLVETVLNRHDDAMKEIGTSLSSKDDFFFVGGGPSFGTANFGAAKVKELSLDHAVALELEEYHHFRSLKSGEPLFLIAPPGQSHDRAVETAEAAKKANGRVFGVIEDGDEVLASMVDVALSIPPMTEALSPVVYSVPLHLFADHLHVAKGRLTVN